MEPNNTKSGKRIHFLGLVLCLLVFVLSSSAGVYLFLSAPAVPVPALVVEPKMFDFGVVSEGKYSTTFRLKNTSSQPISVLHVVGGCSCTTLSFREVLIPPHDTVAMECTLDTTGKSETFRSSIMVGYVLGDVSLIDKETTVKPLRTFIDLQATVK